MQYDRVFPEAMPGELHIPPFCAPQRMDAEIPAAVQSGGYFSLSRTRLITKRYIASGALLSRSAGSGQLGEFPRLQLEHE